MTDRLLQSVCLLLYLLINVLFVAKYGSRITDQYLLLLLAYILVVPAAIWLFGTLPDLRNLRAVYWGLITLIVLAVLGSYVVIPQETLRVDRYEMIRLFWDNVLEDRNPYTRRPHGGNIPGPFPFYFYLALPFYLIGELGLFTISGFLLFALLVDRFVREDREKVLIAILIGMSPAVGWELMTRSTLFLNTSLVLAVVFYVHGMDLRKRGRMVISAVLYGLTLSTRSVVVLLLGPFFFHSGIHAQSVAGLARWGLFAVAAFVVTLVPVVFYEGFFSAENPFAVQSFFLYRWIPIAALAALCLLGLAVESVRHVLFGCTLGIALLVTIYFFTEVSDHGLADVLFHDRADISYFILGFPSLLLVIANSFEVLKGNLNSSKS